MERGRVYPSEEHLGQKCEFWDSKRQYCTFPSPKVFGRLSCRGVIDEPCLHMKDNRPITHPNALPEEVQHEVYVHDHPDHFVPVMPDTSAETSL